MVEDLSGILVQLQEELEVYLEKHQLQDNIFLILQECKGDLVRLQIDLDLLEKLQKGWEKHQLLVDLLLCRVEMLKEVLHH